MSCSCTVATLCKELKRFKTAARPGPVEVPSNLCQQPAQASTNKLECEFVALRVAATAVIDVPSLSQLCATQTKVPQVQDVLR